MENELANQFEIVKKNMDNPVIHDKARYLSRIIKDIIQTFGQEDQFIEIALKTGLFILCNGIATAPDDEIKNFIKKHIDDAVDAAMKSVPVGTLDDVINKLEM